MKAAILAVAPDVRLVDVTHDIAPQDVMEGALALEAIVPMFPAGTVHVAVVDPGVGTTRRGILVEVGGHVLVGPDNGLFTPFVTGAEARVFELRVERYRRPVVSATFHGRDIFGPAAAHVARGVAASRFGPPIARPITLPWPRARSERGRIRGEVVHVDRFGNLVTSIRDGDVATVQDEVTVRVRGRALRLVRTYGDLGPGALGALIGSGGRLEVSARGASAARTLGARRGAPVVVSPSMPTRSTKNRSRRS